MNRSSSRYIGRGGVWVVAGLAVVLLVLLFLQFLNTDSRATPRLPRVAHAGGEFDGLTYTNSFEALNANLAQGFTHFEIDFSWTSDGQLVCLHDWQESFERSFGGPAVGPVSLAEFEALVTARSPVRKCTLSSLADWLTAHPETVLITDVKEDYEAALRHIQTNHPRLLDRIIPQIYQPGEFDLTRSLGFERVIWTLYQYAGSNADVMRELSDMPVWAVTMDVVRAGQRLGRRLEELGVPSYTHTINDYADFLYFRNLGIDEVYTDTLSPEWEARELASSAVVIEDSAFYQEELGRQQRLEREVEQFRALPTSLFDLSDNNWRTIELLNQITDVQPLSQGFSLRSTGTDPHLALPELAEPARSIVILLDITAEDAGYLELFYSTRRDTGFSESRKLQQPLRWGRNTVLIAAEDDSPITQIRIDPGVAPGLYEFNAIDIRAE
ncbi:MAG: glycerophosphodiester phosphodiesterase family protein [Pseudohongiellaceae bacterium]